MGQELEIIAEALELKEYYLVAKGKETHHIGRIKLDVKYNCQKLLGKCEEDFDIELHVKPEDIHTDIEIEKLDFKPDGKLSAAAEGSNLHVEVKRGKGEGYVEAIYRIGLTGLQIEGRHEVILRFYRKIAKTGELIEIPNATYKFIIDVVEPPQIEDVKIEPDRNIFETDKFRVIVLFKSFIDDQIDCKILYGSEKIEKTFSTEQHKNYEIVGEFTALTNINKIIIELNSSKLQYSRKREVELLVKKPPRTEVIAEEIDKDIRIGEKASLNLKLYNRSLSNSVKLIIRGNIYEHRIEKHIELEPNEERLVLLETPQLSIESLKISEANLEIIEYLGEFVISKVIKYLSL